jgi:hypothetical protein
MTGLARAFWMRLQAPPIGQQLLNETMDVGAICSETYCDCHHLQNAGNVDGFRVGTSLCFLAIAVGRRRVLPQMTVDDDDIVIIRLPNCGFALALS